jgi:hypothetical protein
MRNAIAFVFFAILFVIPIPSYADAIQDKPTNESLLAFWEQSQIKNPNTVKFEKTDVENVYNYETKYFPYKGKLKVINLLVDKNIGGFYDVYDDDDGYQGIVEVELSDAPEKFQDKYSYSYLTWGRTNKLYYDPHTSKWYVHDDWMEHEKSLKAQDSGSCQQSSTTHTLVSRKQVIDFFFAWGPFLIFIGLWLWVCVFSAPKLRKRQKEIQDKVIKLSEDTLAIQKEILDALKKK